MSTFLKFILKLIILIGLTVFALVNYRILSLDKGWSIVDINNKTSISAVELINSIPTKIEYYKKTISNSEYDYKVFISTNEKNYLFDAKEEEIKALDFLGLFAKNLSPEKITPIPFYCEIVVGIIILIVPFGRRRKRTQED